MSSLSYTLWRICCSSYNFVTNRLSYLGAMYYNISSGDTCASVTIAMGISLTDFYFLNPEVNATTCANLELGESYCVKAVGNIASYPGYGLVILETAAKAHITDGIIIDEQMHQDLRTHAEGFHSLQAAM